MKISRTNVVEICFLFLMICLSAAHGLAQDAEDERKPSKFNADARPFSAQHSFKRADSLFPKSDAVEKETACDDRGSVDFATYSRCRLNEAPFRRPVRRVDDAEKDNSNPNVKNGFRMGRALAQSGLMLGVQHGFRLLQKKTRRELGGPFFRDWADSVKNLRGWRDSDNVLTNYFAHPLQGGVTGRIYLTNSPEASRLEFGKSRRYWKSRFNAMLWSAFWSTQFELGPVSEATIGNVGLRRKNGVSTMGYVDLVMTPTAGTAIVIGEDAIEKYVLNKMLRKNDGRANFKIKLLRSFLTPTISLNNLLRGKVPWKRDGQMFQAGK